MRCRSVFLVAVGLLLLPAAGLSSQESMDELIDAWESAFNAGDYEAAAALYTANAVRYPPGAPPQQGRDAIAADMANSPGLRIELEVIGSEGTGDTMASWGTYALYERSGERTLPVQSGPWMNVCVRRDGAWRIHRDIWNERQPTEASGD